MKTAKRLEGIGEYYFSQKLREIDQLNKEGKNIINLGIGSPDMPPHPDVIKILQDESCKHNTHAYQSYKGSPILRQAISNWYRQYYDTAIDAETEILPLMGSKEGILHICMTYLNEGDIALVPNPGYPTYAAAVKLAGGTVQHYSMNDENFLQVTGNDKIKLAFFNYPHMPTGMLPVKGMFEKIVKWARKENILVVHDNPYSFILNENPMSLFAVEGARDCVVELNSLSKSHNMAGWRVGAAIASKENIDNILKFKSNMDSGMFLPVQLAAAKALSLGNDWYESVNKTYKARREKVSELLNKLNCSYSGNQSGLFIWAKVPASYKDGYELSDDILYNSNVFITPGGIFGTEGNDFIRVSLCSTEEKITEAIHRIKK